VFLVTGFQQGVVTTGDFALLLTINGAIITNLWTLSADILKCSELVGNINQGLQVALAPMDMQDAPEAKKIHIHQGGIVFEQVQFGYRGGSLLFDDKSIVIEPGQKVGLVGYSGSGKSTFVNLILRLYDVTSGRILIDGQDISNVTLKSLRDSIAMIPQDPSMFHRSLIENIRYGRPDATDEEIVEAAKRAHAHDFIVKLPLGYNSPVGERGSKLSGGQRQRIAIARAILKDSPILILDEATSQLDSVTESEIQDSLHDLMQNKTTLVIAHRLSTLLNMDRILVFDKGKIVEDGTHDELIARGGLYKTLWSAQVGGFLPNNRADQQRIFQAS
jgi:ATP-binding cassette subfamily B protein